MSPEGWLIGLVDIKDAELGALAEAPWCFVKTQYGPIEGHVTLVELLAQLKARFIPDLEVLDEGGYWEHRSLDKLRQSFSVVQRAIDGLGQALEQDGLSPEAAEDPEILATRIERLAARVHEAMSRPAEHPPATMPEGSLGLAPDQREEEAHWDALYEENRRRQERMERAIEERLLGGEEIETALEAAFAEMAPLVEEGDEHGEEAGFSLEDADDNAAEDWQASEQDSKLDASERHPLQARATALLLQFYDIARQDDRPNTNLELLLRSAGEIGGGLAQALPLPPTYELEEIDAGLSLVQLKRALRGAAFVTGALRLLVADNTIDRPQFERFTAECQTIASEIIDLLRSIRDARK